MLLAGATIPTVSPGINAVGRIIPCFPVPNFFISRIRPGIATARVLLGPLLHLATPPSVLLPEPRHVPATAPSLPRSQLQLMPTNPFPKTSSPPHRAPQCESRSRSCRRSSRTPHWSLLGNQG